MTFGTTPKDNAATPLGSVYVPGTTNSDLTALQGGPASTDANNQKSAPAAMYLADGSDVAQGASTDAANANSVIGQLKQIKANTASVVLGSSGNVIGVIAWGGTATIGVPSNNGLTIIKSSAGRLASVIVTTTGSAQLNIYDNTSIASGTIIGAVPANAAVGSVYQFNSPAANGIVANAVANCCATTICYY